MSIKNSATYDIQKNCVFTPTSLYFVQIGPLNCRPLLFDPHRSTVTIHSGSFLSDCITHGGRTAVIAGGPSGSSQTGNVISITGWEYQRNLNATCHRFAYTLKNTRHPSRATARDDITARDPVCAVWKSSLLL